MMTKEQAIQILDQAVSQLNVNRATHQQLMNAINVLKMPSVGDVYTEKDGKKEKFSKPKYSSSSSD